MFLCLIQILNMNHCVINNLYSRKGNQDQDPNKKALIQKEQQNFGNIQKLYNKVGLTRPVFNLHLPPGYLSKPAHE